MNNVDHPSHYNLYGRKECIVEMEEKYGIAATTYFCLLNAYKYLYRAGNKGEKQEDLDKARWYFNWAVDKDAYHIDGIKQLYDDIKERLTNHD